MNNAYQMQSAPPYLLAWAMRLLTGTLLYSVPNEFWVQMGAMLEIPSNIIEFFSPLVGASCWTIVEVIQAAMKAAKMREDGLTDQHYSDPTAKFWPLKIFVGWMCGLICNSLFAPGVIAIIPKATPTAIGYIAGAIGYWFMSKRLPKILANKEDDEA